MSCVIDCLYKAHLATLDGLFCFGIIWRDIMDWKSFGETLHTWMEEEWYMGLFIFFGFVLFFSLFKLAKKINSSTRFPNSKDN